MTKYATWTRQEMVSEAEARGYSKVKSLTKSQLARLLADDDAGKVDERRW